MHALHITIHVEDGVTNVAINNLAREDSNQKEQKMIKAVEELIGEIFKISAKDGDEIKEIGD